MQIGNKIKKLRLQNDLTLEELANRTELSKGFLSQLERDKTTTSIQTLLDILEVLGTTPGQFFEDNQKQDKVVFTPDDCFIQENKDFSISWLVPNAQKNDMEPILLHLQPHSQSNPVLPFEGEAFGYVISGQAILVYGSEEYTLKKGYSFYLEGSQEHLIKNNSSKVVSILWIATPPIF